MPHSTTNGTDRQGPRRCMLITNPRTCSNLLVRILAPEKQRSTKHGSYHFLECIFHLLGAHLLETSPNDWSEENKKAVYDQYNTGIENMQKNLTPGPDEDCQVVFTKEHVETITEPTKLVAFANGLDDVREKPWRWNVDGKGSWSDDSIPPYSPENLTIFPDDYLETWAPIFLVRHPVRAFESIYRSLGDVLRISTTISSTEAGFQSNLRAHMTLHWTRQLYEWYISRGLPAIIVDADDVIVHTKPLTQKLARYIGFDPDMMQYTWKQASESELAAQEVALRRMKDSLDASSGVVADPEKAASSVGSVEEQVPRWTEKYDEKVAELLRERVQAAMEDYEWLRERRMMP